MDDVTDRERDDAEARGTRMLKMEPRAVAAHYDPHTARVVVDLANGCTYAFPARLAQDLQNATASDLACIEVDGLGFNLHWPALDADIYVPALVAGIFGTRAWMARELARVAGQATSRLRPPPRAPMARGVAAPARQIE